MRSGLFFAISALLMLWNLSQGGPPSLGLSSGMLILLAWGLELAFIALPEVGFFSACVAPYLALCLMPGGLKLAVLAVPLGAALRAFSGRGRGAAESAGPLLALMLSITVAGALTPLTASGLARIFVALLVAGSWVGLQIWIARDVAATLEAEERLRWWPVFRRLGGLRIGAALAALPLLVATEHDPIMGLMIGPLLWCTHLGAGHIIHRAYVEDVDAVKGELETSHQELDSARGKIRKTEEALKSTLDQRTLLEDYNQQLGMNPDLEATFRATLKLARRVAPGQHVALFQEEEGRLVLTHCLEQPEVVERIRLTGAQEELAEIAHQTRDLQLLDPEKPMARVFPSDDNALALPLASNSVLYIGRTGNFLQQELDQLQFLSSHADFAFEAARRYQKEKEALELYGQAHEALTQRAERLTGLAHWSAKLTQPVKSDFVMETLRDASEALFPTHAGLLLYGPERGWSGALQWGGEGEWSAEALRPLLKTLQENDRPLLLDDLELSRFDSPHPACGALLAAPMKSSETIWGGLFLAADEFDGQHYQLMELLASLGAVALAKARHFHEIEESRKRLEESQSQLVQSGKMAAVGQLAAGVAHELNSPLGAIQLAVSAARRQVEKKPESAVKKLERAEKAAARAREIIDKLLVFSRKSGQDRQRVIPAEVIKDSVELVGHVLKKQNIQVGLKVEPNLGFLGHPNQIQQVLVNLILNAKDAMLANSQGARELLLEARAEQDQVIVAVTDSGVGLSEEEISRIFEPFYTTKELGKGTGLGLAVSHQIVTEQGGVFDVTSTPGRGSTFAIKFPQAH